MKKLCLLFTLIWLIPLASTAMATDGRNYSAAASSVESILSHCKSLVDLQKSGMEIGRTDYADKLRYMAQNKNRLIKAIARTKNFYNLAVADRIITRMYNQKDSYLGYSYDKPMVRGQQYLDTITGHKYIKKGNQTYAEYGKKGKYLKTVAADQTHLATNRSIQPILEDCYLLYMRSHGENREYMTLPADHAHPENWKLHKALVALE